MPRRDRRAAAPPGAASAAPGCDGSRRDGGRPVPASRDRSFLRLPRLLRAALPSTKAVFGAKPPARKGLASAPRSVAASPGTADPPRQAEGEESMKARSAAPAGAGSAALLGSLFGLGLLGAAAPAAAQFLVVANDEKVWWD